MQKALDFHKLTFEQAVDSIQSELSKSAICYLLQYFLKESCS